MFKVSHNVLRWVLVYLKIGEIMAGTCVQLSLCTSLKYFKHFWFLGKEKFVLNTRQEAQKARGFMEIWQNKKNKT